MIVKDEAHRLPQCLASVQGLVQEMVVLDTGSQDKTPTIAKKAGAKVFKTTWPEDFAQARNQALAKATGDWVLVLDADETLNPKMLDSIQRAMAEDHTLVVNLMRQEVGAVQSPYSLVSRLFRRHPALCFNRPYHETIDDSVLALLEQEPGWRVVDLPGVAILHTGYSPEQLGPKQERAQTLLEKALAENPQDAYLCSKLGALYNSLGQDKEGIKLLKQGLKSNRASIPVRFELHYHLANAYQRQKKWELALKHYQKALDEEILLPLKLGALNNYGALLHDLGDLAQAKKIFATVIQIDPTLATGHYNLGRIFKAQGQLLEAIKAYQRAIELNPNYAPAYQNLGVAAFKAGLLAESLDAFKTAISLYDQQGSPEGEVLRRSLQEMGMIE
jgi:tetratricopeptide (TPR) repeat protein